MKFIIALALVALVAQSQALPRMLKIGSGRIVGGEQVTRRGEVPHQILLLYGGSFICGGSILNDRHIVTAAHCAEIGSASQFSIHAGLNNRVTPEAGAQRNVRVSAVKIHPEWDTNNLINDIAVMTLSTPLNLGESYYTAAVKVPAKDEQVSGEVQVTGWGATTEGGSISTILRSVTVPVVSNEECNKAYSGDVQDTMVCAGVNEGGKDSCQGDSGGPFVQNGVLHGVVSWGYGCARRGYPGVYTRVSKFTEFLAGFQ